MAEIEKKLLILYSISILNETYFHPVLNKNKYKVSTLGKFGESWLKLVFIKESFCFVK